jgi:1A family penicillin-binding protein
MPRLNAQSRLAWWLQRRSPMRLELTPYKLLQRLEARARVRWLAARKAAPRTTMAVAGALVVAAVLSVGSGMWFLTSLWMTLPDREAIGHMGEMDQATSVFDKDDRIAFTIFKEQRIEVPLSEMSPHLVRALIAVEDQRFYDHNGFDIVRIASAAFANLRHRRVTQGASTLTQQLARQSFLTLDKTWRRKIQELILAGRIESAYSKDKILELYLNKVYFGDGLYGVEAAARGFFDKHASELSVPEAALLAGLVKSPSSFAPTISAAKAKSRRNVVLQAMLDHGDIDRATFESGRRSPIVLHDGLNADEPVGEYFKEQVRRELVDRFGWQVVYQGGLRVFSTVDMGAQREAESAIAAGLTSLDARRRAIAERKARQQKPARVAASAAPKPVATVGTEPPAPQLQAALVAMDPVTGHVRAMVGGRDFTGSRFNRAVQAKRQPGSAFKPFVYAAALESGFTPATLIDHLNDPISTLEGAWTPEDEHSSADSMTLRTGLRTSSNRAAVQLLQRVGISRTVQYAKSMGVGDVPSVPSLALGSGEVTLESMTAAYSAFANHGLVPTAILIRRVEDRDGRVLFTASESSTRAITDTTAFLMSNMLADVINAGTGARARSLGFTLPAAGKTGTTNDFHDAWFVGFTPRLAAGVWVGFDQPKTILPNGFAADVAVPIWAAFMKAATKGAKPEWMAPPRGITTASVCRLSGQLATSECEHVDVVDKNGQIENRSLVYTEYFLTGTEPHESCELHQPNSILSTIASIFHTNHSRGDSAPVRVEDAGLPIVPVAPAVVTVAPEASDSAPVLPPSTPKKRGFWSKLFGVGKDDDHDEKKTPKKK